MTTFRIINIGTLSMNRFWGETERVREPSATCTLLECGGQRILVDPSPKGEILKPLLFARAGLRPEDIDAVFLTHFHGDHRFGLKLFDGIPWLMAKTGLTEWQERAKGDAALIARFLPVEGRLPEGLGFISTPGHTRGHCSLCTETDWGTLIVTGDAVMTREFLASGEGFHNSVDPEQAAATIADIRGRADLIIPGHDNLLINRRRA